MATKIRFAKEIAAEKAAQVAAPAPEVTPIAETTPAPQATPAAPVPATATPASVRTVKVSRQSRANAARLAFLDAHPGLEAALACQHRIVQDIAERFAKWGSISDKQVALVLKLAAEANAPKPEVAPEIVADAPTGRVTFRGTVVCQKVYDSDFGPGCTKILVRVEAPNGVWKA